MNAVQPIRDVEKIKDISDYLRSRSERDYMLFQVGIHVPVRISDLLKLKVRDVKNKEYISIRESKKRKEIKIPINRELKEKLRQYVANKEPYEYLFESRQKDLNGNSKAICRQTYYHTLKKAASNFGVHFVGCHTMRKTFGYHFYQQTNDIVKLQEILNHSESSYTKRYIGLTQDSIDDSIGNFEYKPLD